ncbi:MAG: immune inhibitor A [Candidatus Altiarchaeota archaeon]|nr:immune inhibitor A [Candidatus Altiarchaeota archaeon]
MKKGLFFTLGVLLLVIPLILFIAYYATISQTKSEDTIAKIRCDELHYFVEDIKNDLSRALVIFGRRAAIYAIDEVVSTGSNLDNYVFNCSTQCNIDCQEFRYGINGSEAAITELIVCGTLEGENIEYMVNHSLNQWVDRIESRGAEIHFNTSIDVNHVEVIPKDPFTFTVILNSSLEISDKSGICYFKDEEVITKSDTSIIGLEDPLFPLNTNSFVIKFIQNCTTDVRTEYSAGCSAYDEPGDDTATGNIVFHSDIKGEYGSLESYCVGQYPQVINNQILVLDQAFGGCGSYDEAACFNVSHPNHFAAVINYGPNSPESFLDKCDITIPWITDTGDIDNVTPRSPPRRVEECDEKDIYAGACVAVVNNINCGIHQVVLGSDSEDINTTCYRLSNASKYGLYDGPSFFDRLDGRLNLSEKYKNQSLKHYNTQDIGLETLVNPYLIDERGIPVKANATWVDYLYWQWTYGCQVEGACSEGNYLFRLDDAHADMYHLDTTCHTVPGCPDSTEVCVNYVDDDEDGNPDWLDYDCQASFAGCGLIKSCDPLDLDVCSTCFSQQPPILSEDTETICSHYGYNTTEWHIYQMTPTQDGLLSVVFNGISNVTDSDKTDLSIINYSMTGSCTSQVDTEFDMEEDSTKTYCVKAGETYAITLDVDSPGVGYNGSYRLGVYLDGGNPACATTPTTSTTTTTTTTTPAAPCGLFDDMESGVGGWSHSGAQDEWELGSPSWGSAHSGTLCWGTDLYGQYQNNADESLKSQSIDLTSATSPALRYYTKYRLEDGDDFAYIEASTNGISWDTLDAITGAQNSWSQRSVSLAGYQGSNIYIRFRLNSDENIRRLGLYIDDVNISCG